MTQRRPFRCCRSSPEVIRLAVRLYVRFPLPLRNLEDRLHERGIAVGHETVRVWWQRCGPSFASEIRRERTQGLRSVSRWRWPPDAVVVKVNGAQPSPWRAADRDGEVLKTCVSKHRDRAAARTLPRRLMTRHGRPEEPGTDRRRACGAALAAWRRLCAG